MSSELWTVLITTIGSLLGTAITAWASNRASTPKRRSKKSKTRTWLWVVVGAVVGGALALGGSYLFNEGIFEGGESTVSPTVVEATATENLPTATVMPSPTATLAPSPTATLTPSPTATLAPSPTPTLTPPSTLTPAPSPTPDDKLPWIEVVPRYVGQNVTVRFGPDASYEILGSLSPLLSLRIESRLSDSSWVKLDADQEIGEDEWVWVKVFPDQAMEEGWIKADLLEVDVEDLERLEIYNSDGMYCVNISQGVNVRDCNSTECSEVGVLGYGACIAVAGRSSDSEWVLIGESSSEYPGMWLISRALVKEEFLGHYLGYGIHREYIEGLDEVTLPPTPEG